MMEWLLFTSQLPTSSSSLRVMVWRRMKAAGAIGLQNGVWVLPRTKEQEQLLQELLAYVQEQGGEAQSFIATPMNKAMEDELLQRVQAQRGEEYAELNERCQGMLGELEKETKKKKFTFAELEENEEDLKKLESWLAKIEARDPVGGKQTEETKRQIEACKIALKEFASRVYEKNGLASGDNADLSGEK
jgi:molecular chaperone DnaK (HSP70)